MKIIKKSFLKELIIKSSFIKMHEKNEAFFIKMGFLDVYGRQTNKGHALNFVSINSNIQAFICKDFDLNTVLVIETSCKTKGMIVCKINPKMIKK